MCRCMQCYSVSLDTPICEYFNLLVMLHKLLIGHMPLGVHICDVGETTASCSQQLTKIRVNSCG